MVAAQIAQTRRGGQETAAITLLLVGGFLAGVGWLVGVVLLWLSDVWSWRDKLLATLVVPGGLVLPLYLAIGIAMSSGSSKSCIGLVGQQANCTTIGGRPGWEQFLLDAFLILLVVAPIMVAVHLARTSRRPA